jgi:hypothetical protein
MMMMTRMMICPPPHRTPAWAWWTPSSASTSSLYIYRSQRFDTLCGATLRFHNLCAPPNQVQRILNVVIPLTTVKCSLQNPGMGVVDALQRINELRAAKQQQQQQASRYRIVISSFPYHLICLSYPSYPKQASASPACSSCDITIHHPYHHSGSSF